MALKIKATNYTKPQVLQIFRKLADENTNWRELQKTELDHLECRGELVQGNVGGFTTANGEKKYPLPNTAMSKRDLRHSLRDICRAVGMMDEVSNSRMDAAHRDRTRTQAEYDAFYNERTRWGEYFDKRQKFKSLPSAEIRVRKVAVLDDRRRELCAIRDEAVDTFSDLEDQRFNFDRICKEYSAAFEDYKPWSPPDQTPPVDGTNPQQLALESIDFTTLGLDDCDAFFIEHLSGRLVGSAEHGPLYFLSEKAARKFTEDDGTLALKMHKMSPDRILEICRWFSLRPRFVDEKPKGSKLLYEEYEQLLEAQPYGSVEFDEALEAVQPRKGW